MNKNLKAMILPILVALVCSLLLIVGEKSMVWRFFEVLFIITGTIGASASYALYVMEDEQ